MATNPSLDTPDEGFVRPLRRVCRHAGMKIPDNLRDLTAQEKIDYPFEEYDYVKFEEFGPEKAPLRGSFWKQPRFDKIHIGCQNTIVLEMDVAIALAQDPSSKRMVFCPCCHDYFSIGTNGQFVWDNTSIRVGT